MKPLEFNYHSNALTTSKVICKITSGVIFIRDAIWKNQKHDIYRRHDCTSNLYLTLKILC